MKMYKMKKLRSLHKKMKFSIKGFFSKCDQIHSFLRIWSHLLKKSLIENFNFCAVYELEQHYISVLFCEEDDSETKLRQCQTFQSQTD